TRSDRWRSAADGSAGSSVEASGKQPAQRRVVDLGQGIQIRHADMFVDLVNGRVDRPQFHYLGTQGGDETAIRGPAGGRGLGFPARRLAYRRTHPVEKVTRLGEEGQARHVPFQLVVQSMALEKTAHPLLQAIHG